MIDPGEAGLSPARPVLSNAEIADRLARLAQLLAAEKENPYKVKAYRRASAKLRTLSESIDELVHEDADLTAYAGIGEAIGGAIREIVLTGTLGKLEELRSRATPQVASISDHRASILSAFSVFIRSSISIPSRRCANISKMERSRSSLVSVWPSTSVWGSPTRMQCCSTRLMTCALPWRSI